MKQHTPEPWAWFETEDGAASCVAEGMAVARCNVHDPFGQDAINARRIAACVNACAGIPTERLDEWASVGGIEKLFGIVISMNQAAAMVRAEQQRDELLLQISEMLSKPDAHVVLRERDRLITALENVMQHLILGSKDFHKRKAMRIAETAIDSVKGGAE